LQQFNTIAAASGVHMKKLNTIIGKWPTALKRRLGEKDAQEEFERLLASNFTGLERYVEWQRTE